MSELCDLTAVELRRMIGCKEISPVELLDACLARIEIVNPTLNAVVCLDEPAAREAAKQAEQAVMAGEELGLLHGLPVGIKDLNETQGLTTTFGSRLFADHVPTQDDGLTASTRKAGAVVIGKTNTPEHGAGANTFNAVYGHTGNPFDPEKSCAGSSGGSAVAVAAGMMPLASGSDYGGSLRTPASFCGVVGLRPTPGRVPALRSQLAYSPMSVDGPMARNVADAALYLDALAGYDERDPFSRPAGAGGEASLQPAGPADLASLKVALSEDLGFAPVDDQVRALFRSRLETLSGLPLRCEERDPDMQGADRAFEVIRGVGFLSAHLEKYQKHRDLLGPNVIANVELAQTYTAEDVAWASVRHSEIYRSFLAYMQDYDVLITPAVAAQPFDKQQTYGPDINGERQPTYIHWVGIAYGVTLGGHPALVIPCGVDEDGLPFGLQLVGQRHGERRLLAIGAALEQAFAGIERCRRPQPNIPSLMAAA